MSSSRSDAPVVEADASDPLRPSDHADSGAAGPTQPQLGVVGWLRWGWRQLTSMQTALDAMSQGLCLYDADHRLVVANRRYEEIFGTATSGTGVYGGIRARI